VAEDVLIYVDHEGGTPKRTALEAVTKASQMAGTTGGQVFAAALGQGATQAVSRLAQYGVDTVYVNDDGVFDNYLSAPCAPMDMICCTSHDGAYNIPHRPCSKWMNRPCSTMFAINSTNCPNLLPRLSTIASVSSALCTDFIPDIRCRQGRATSNAPITPDPHSVTAAHSA